MRRLETGVIAVVLAVLALGLALLPLLAPPFTQLGTARFSALSREEASGPAETTRSFVVSGSEESRRRLEELMPPDAVSHLDDVRRVISGAQTTTFALAVAFLAWIAWRLRVGEKARVVTALRAGAAVTALTVLAPALFAAADFDAFFVVFHSLFFAAGTWVFPSDSLLIRLFPESFWVAAGASWAVLVLVVAASYFGASFLLDRRRR